MAIRESVQESDQGILFLIREFKVAELPLVEIGRVLGRWPASDLFAGITYIAPGQNVPCIVKVHDLFQAFEVTVVHVGFYKA